MKVTVLLCDKGTQNPQAGTLNLLNVGWSQTLLRPAAVPVPGGLLTAGHAIAAFFEVEPVHCNHPIELIFELLDEDGHSVEVPGQLGPQTLRIVQQIIIQSPAGVPSGSPGTGNAMVEIVPGLPLSPGRYEWRVHLDGETQEDWGARFQVNSFVVGQPMVGNPPEAPGGV